MYNRHDCFQALLNFKNMIDAHDDSFLNSKKKYKIFIISLIKIMLENPMLLDEFMTYGGDTRYMSNKIWVKPNGEVFIKDGDKT